MAPTWERVGFCTDEHHPYAEPRAISLSLQILEEFDPHILVVGSDGCNFAAFSKFPDWIRYRGEVALTKQMFLAGIREKRDVCPNAKLYYIAGNHDQRLDTLLREHPQLSEIEEFSFENWLELKKYKLRFHYEADPFGRTMLSQRLELTPNLLVLHGDYVRKYSGWSGKAQLLEGERMMTSLLMGHCHRGGKFETADREGKPIGAYECYHHQRMNLLWLKGKNPDWQWGICLVETQMRKPWQFSVEQVNYLPTMNGKLRARWRGKEFISK